MRSPALDALDSAGIAYRVIRHGPVRSLAEAADARGVEPADVVKTMVVRRGESNCCLIASSTWLMSMSPTTTSACKSGRYQS